ncbi:MAG: alcohol dehydrogenase catalytic domain-containing protein [Planctomycetes bacterium]|nr:alcohol dehydrogenase catalytic domain-containing protein [Planctomycetota bacterium]
MQALSYRHVEDESIISRTLQKFSWNRQRSSWPDFQLAELPRPELPDSNWVRIEVEIAGIDSYEVESLPAIFEGSKHHAAVPPVIPGTEVIGFIVETGADVQSYREGDRVLIDPILPYARDGSRRHGGFAIGASAFMGGWAQETVAHRTRIQKISHKISKETAMLIPTYADALHACLRGLAKEPKTIAVVGSGVCAIAITAMLRYLDYKDRVIVIGNFPHTPDWLWDAGADFIVRHFEDVSDGLEEVAAIVESDVAKIDEFGLMLTGGFDLVFETTGTDSGLDLAMRVAKPGGNVVMSRHRHLQSINWSPFFFRELTLVSAHSHAIESAFGKPDHAFNFIIKAIKSGNVIGGPLLTHTFDLSDFEKALTVSTNPVPYNAIKVAFSMQ